MKKSILILIVIFSFPFGKSWNGVAQNTDSLYSVWEDVSQHDTVRAKSWLKYIEIIQIKLDVDSAFIYLEKCYPLIIKSGNKRLLGSYFVTEANLYSKQSDYKITIEKF